MWNIVTRLWCGGGGGECGGAMWLNVAFGPEKCKVAVFVQGYLRAQVELGNKPGWFLYLREQGFPTRYSALSGDENPAS